MVNGAGSRRLPPHSMARTFPRTLNPAEVKSNGERKVFERLRDELPDPWEVFHSASLVIRDPGSGTTDDECDFVLAHPEKGLIALEVKGGPLECRQGEWQRPNDAGELERIPDPGTQAIDHRYNLARKLAEVDGWTKSTLRLHWALALPDVTVHELALGPDLPHELIIDRSELRDGVAQAVEGVLAYSNGARPSGAAPGPEGMEKLRALLCPEVDLRVTLADEIGDEQVELLKLTNEQGRTLQALRRNPRVLVRGCAGSGKTMLALARARELSEEGRSVLLVCFNRALVTDIRERGLAGGADVFTFHGLCVRWAAEAGVELPEYERGEAPQEFFDEDQPNALVEAMGTLGGQYDAILVDEAQDLHDDWLAALACTLRDEDTGSIWLFIDDNQRVYGSKLTVPVDGFAEMELTVNCRNTQAIHREVMKLYEGDVAPTVRGPEGRPVELIHTDDQPATVADLLDRFIDHEGVAAADVVVLSSHALEKSEVGASGAGRFTFSKDASTSADVVRFCSIRAFKGLEAPAVILCELEDLDDESEDAQLYVGMSRARHHCVVVAPPQSAFDTGSSAP